jgi:hypothetical protein
MTEASTMAENNRDKLRFIFLLLGKNMGLNVTHQADNNPNKNIKQGWAGS